MCQISAQSVVKLDTKRVAARVHVHVSNPKHNPSLRLNHLLHPKPKVKLLLHPMPKISPKYHLLQPGQGRRVHCKSASGPIKCTTNSDPIFKSVSSPTSCTTNNGSLYNSASGQTSYTTDFGPRAKLVSRRQKECDHDFNSPFV